MADAPARRTGLGRGLQALLPNAGDQPHAPDPGAWLPEVDRGPSPRLSAVVESGLAVLQRAVGVDVCAYVHGREPGRPYLWLHAGPGATLTPAEWMELGIAAVGAVLGQVRMPRTLTLGRTELLAVPTRGGASSGVHLLGRCGGGIGDHERTVAIHLVQALGEALHGLMPEQDEAGFEPPDAAAPVPEVPALPGASAAEPPGEDGAGRPVPGAVPAAASVRSATGRVARMAAVAQWPAPVDLEEVVREAVVASGVRHSELHVRLLAERGADVIDVAAGHRGDRVRVVLPADPSDPARAANSAASQTVNLLQLIGADGPPVEQRAG